ncbi:hypothetical protein NDK43_06645 [Neobacillus pocheonensis]|uniref:Uncharacterized protein n=1 Tax=Neobacillus pocheonensis TaxID=363869 RepID=A0ABT0W733_9BACI|nr:hypothetical protein [Neobacillus pocheonensis]
MSSDTFNQLYEEILRSKLSSIQKNRKFAQLVTVIEHTLEFLTAIG